MNLEAVKSEYIFSRVELLICETFCRTPLVSRVCDCDTLSTVHLTKF